jgi:hypothetical protein
MPSYHLHTSNDAKQIFTGQHVELTVAQGASTETAHCITIQENYLLPNRHLQQTWQLTVPQRVPETQPHKPLPYTRPTQTPYQPAHYHTYHSPVYVEVPQFMRSLNTYTISIVCGTVLRTSYNGIRIYADSDGETWTGGNFPLSHSAPQHIRTVYVITQPQKLQSQLVGLVTAVMYQVTDLMCCLVYGMGMLSAGIFHNNLARYVHH